MPEDGIVTAPCAFGRLRPRSLCRRWIPCKVSRDRQRLGAYMKRALRIALATFGMAVVATRSVAYETHHWHGPAMYAVLRHGEQAFELRRGQNKLDEPTSITCHSSLGCLISFAANVLINSESFPSCVEGLVDGREARPRCPFGLGPTGYIPSRQSAFVLPGKHVIQTVVDVDGAGGAGRKVYTWEVDYTIYEKLPPRN
jgi:hypothetical protein